MRTYIQFTGILLFLTGFLIMAFTGCDGYWVNCWHGWTKTGVILCTIGVAFPLLVEIVTAIVYTKKK